MLKLGDYNTLRIKKRTDYGLYLDGGDEGNILLPNRYVTQICILVTIWKCSSILTRMSGP